MSASRLLLAVGLLVGGWSSRAEACSCSEPGPPCATMYLSTVFVGTVTNVKESSSGNTVTTFEVTDLLHSAKPLGKSVDVHHTNIGSMCGLTFKKGTAYVVYAGGDQLSASACSRTHQLRKGDEDVAYAHAKRDRTEALVEGVVVLTDGDSGRPRADVEVRAVGTAVSAKSDAKGKFKLLLPPGEYALEVLTDGLRSWQGRTPRLSLPVASACATPVFNVTWDGRIEGKLVDPKGKPVVGLEVIATARREQDQHWRLSGVTDAYGKYLIHEVPAGEFYVGVSLPDFGGASPISPYPTTYFPGVADLKSAKIVKMERAGLSSGVDFVLPAPRVIRKVSGIVKNRDGSPASASVNVSTAERNRSTGLSTDAKGAFSLDELSGEEVVVKACSFLNGKQHCVEEKRKVEGDVALQLTLPQ